MSSLLPLFSPLPRLAVGAAAVLAVISLSPGSAQAACAPGAPAGTCRVTVGGLTYDVTTFTGKYSDTPSKFQTASNGGLMPWWGNQALASSFLTAAGGGLGYPSPNSFPGLFTPFFAYNQTGFGVSILYADTSGSMSSSQNLVGDIEPYAKAALYVSPAVPAPLPIFGAGAAFGFSRKLRKRIQVARVPVGSGQPLA